MRKKPTMFPHEVLKLLRKGEAVKCGKCGEGVLEPIGNYKTTNTFKCSKCNNQLITN